MCDFSSLKNRPPVCLVRTLELHNTQREIFLVSVEIEIPKHVIENWHVYALLLLQHHPSLCVFFYFIFAIVLKFVAFLRLLCGQSLNSFKCIAASFVLYALCVSLCFRADVLGFAIVFFQVL